MSKLDSYKKLFKMEIPEETQYVVEVSLDNEADVFETLNFNDDVFQVSLETTMHDLAAEIVNCTYGYCIESKMLFVMHEVTAENTIQKIVSMISSYATLKFYKTFLGITLEYQDAIDDEKYKDQPDAQEVIRNRVKDLFMALSKNPLFTAEAFILPEGYSINEIIKPLQHKSIFGDDDTLKYQFGVEAVKENNEWKTDICKEVE